MWWDFFHLRFIWNMKIYVFEINKITLGIAWKRKFILYPAKTYARSKICNIVANRIVWFHALGTICLYSGVPDPDRVLLRISRSWHATSAYRHARSAHYVSFVRCHERHLRMAGIINPFNAGWVSYRLYMPYVMGCAQGRP